MPNLGGVEDGGQVERASGDGSLRLWPGGRCFDVWSMTAIDWLVNRQTKRISKKVRAPLLGQICRIWLPYPHRWRSGPSTESTKTMTSDP